MPEIVGATTLRGNRSWVSFRRTNSDKTYIYRADRRAGHALRENFAALAASSATVQRSSWSSVSADFHD